MRLRSAAVIVGLILGSTSSTVWATGIQGDTINITYNLPTITHVVSNVGNFQVPASGINPYGGSERIALNPNDITYSFDHGSTFLSYSFNGAIFTDLTSSDIKDVSIDPLTNIVGLTASDLNFTANTIALNTSGLSFDTSTVIKLDITVSNVPLPASFPMFGAAVLALSAFGYGLKRKGVTAA